MMVTRRLGLLLASCWLVGCGGKTGAPAVLPVSPAGSAARPEAAAPAASGSPETDPLFPDRKTGWKSVDKATRSRIDVFAGDYFQFVQTSRTQRQSSEALLHLAKAAGAVPFTDTGKHTPGQLLYSTDAAHRSLAILKIGKAPVEEGLRIILSATDAGHLRLTARPIYEKSGLALFDTTVLGDLDLPSWLHAPLALHVYIAPTRAGGKGREIIIGDDPGEPVFSIPDLLPHLSRKVQRGQLIDSPERLDAVAGFSRKALHAGLLRYGIKASEFDRAEARLLPAGEPAYVGVDRALIAASNHHARALPYAAMRAILSSDDHYSQLLIIMGDTRSAPAGAGPEQHLANLLPAAIQQHDIEPDALSLRRIVAKSSVLLFDHLQGERNQGVALNTRRDDSGPAGFRQALALLESAGAQVQVLEAAGWSQARELASLDIDTVEAGLPIAGKGSPYELVSTLDLYQALLAAQAWMQGPRP